MAKEIVVLGFPKCGTTALFDNLSKDAAITTLSREDGGKEYSWPMIKEVAPHADDSTIRAHKFVAYAYSPEALAFLKDYNPDATFVLCVRAPKRSLFSWHRMYRSIAKRGHNKAHLAWRERDFYENCSVSDFYDRFAERRLQYDRHFKNVMAALPKERVVVVSQEYLARDMDGFVGALKNLANGQSEASVMLPPSDTGYKGAADRSKTPCPLKISNALARTQTRLYDAIKAAGVTSFLVEQPVDENAGKA